MAYTTVSDIKIYLGIPSATTTDDTLLTTLLASATSFVNQYTGQYFESTELTKEYGHDSIDGKYLYLNEFVQSITEILNGDGVTEIPSTDYILLPRNLNAYHTIKIKNNKDGFEFPDGHDSFITVTANYGYSSTPPSEIVQCVTRLVSYFYHQKDNHSDLDRAVNTGSYMILPTSIPNDVRLILQKYKAII